MEFLTILIVLGLVQLWGSGGPLQRDDWFYRWGEIAGDLAGKPGLKLLVVIGLPVLIVLLVQAMVHTLLFGLLSLLLYVAVLLFSLGRGNYGEALQRYKTAWNHGDFESAYDKACAIGDFRQSDAIEDAVTLHGRVRQATVYEGYERWFAVVFWFLVLGPCGALAYRLSFLSARSDRMQTEQRQTAMRWVHYLDWIPARILALSFSLTGNFVNVFNRCWNDLSDDMPLPELLDRCALAAIDSDIEQAQPADQQEQIDAGRRELEALQNLISRSVICWVIILAVLTVAGA